MVEDLVRKKGYLTLGTRLKRLSEQLYSQVQELIDDHDLPIQANHYPLLASLDENGPMPVGELAQSLGVSQPGVTRMIGQLSRVGLVQVTRGEKDQRKKVVELCDEGRSVTLHGRQVVWPKIENSLHEVLKDHQGSLLDQLNHLEDALGAQTFRQRAAESNKGENDA